MGKRIIPRRRGRGHRYKAPDNRFKGKARHPRTKSSSGKVVELMHDPGRTAPLAKVQDQDGIYSTAKISSNNSPANTYNQRNTCSNKANH